MYKVRATIEGIAPILFNRFTEQNQSDVSTGRSVGKKTIAQHRELAMLSKVYINDDGIFCPAKNIRKAMMNACSIAGLKRGKKSLGPILNAVMFIDPLEIPFGVDKAEYVDEQVGRIPPRTGARVVIYRPALKAGWQLNFTIQVFDDQISAPQVKQALEDAGVYQGICDGRPEYGRFIVTGFEEVKK